jgi:hypothetical protein
MPLSRETLEFCQWLINQVTVAASIDDFEEQAARVARAKREIAGALAGNTPDHDLNDHA